MCSELSARAENARVPFGYYYVNVSEIDNPYRSWRDMREYGFVSAGEGACYSDELDRLKVGQEIFVYQRRPHKNSVRPMISGYVGYGTVVSAKIPVVEFELPDGGGLLVDQTLEQPRLDHDRESVDRREYAVGVRWKRTFPSEAPVTYDGIFYNHHIACELTDAETIEFLERKFGV